MLLFLVGMIWLRLSGPLIAGLLTYLIVSKLHLFEKRGKWLAVLFLIALVGLATYILGHFSNQTVRALPEIAEKAIPSLLHVANEYEIQLPFDDYATFKNSALEFVRSQTSHLSSVARFARVATAEVALMIIACVVAVAVFLNPRFEVSGKAPLPHSSVFNVYTAQIASRWSTFYTCFERVLGAQILISAINTFLTALFVIAVDLPYAFVTIGVTFLCGLLPVIGNLMSNTIIVCIGLTVSPQMALWALIFLVVIHKLEYFLNSKIIGHRIRNPVWLTLTALVIGERLMGIPGIVLAPIILHYIKTETSAIRAAETPGPLG